MTTMLDAAARRDLLPASAIPLAYFGAAYLGLFLALAALIADPAIPGGFFYHPRMVALVHLVTLGWLTSSILGALYIVAPLALRLPLPARRADWIAFALYTAGAIGMVAHFWIGEYEGMWWSAILVVAGTAHVGSRVLAGLPAAPVPWPIKLHVVFAFVNIGVAAAIGILIGIDRTRGALRIPPLAATYAHAHLAAVGWVTMMVVGLSYRLIPMILPAAMPAGPGLAWSAVLMEAGVAVLAIAFLFAPSWTVAGAVLIAAGLGAFVRQIRETLRRRLPRPPALPRRDWSAWQTHTALLWLLAAVSIGCLLSIGIPSQRQAGLAWIYGVAGLVGFMVQIVIGMQGRLVPLYAWYRQFAALGGQPPDRAANGLPSAAFARAIYIPWALGVPLLAWGLAAGHHLLIRGAAAILSAGLAIAWCYIVYLLRKVRSGS
ncbi:MAG TPA: hypothetical protein VIL35_09965 [Vicinamibacterales bacterium]